MAKEKRFQIIVEQGGLLDGTTKIILDTETGVQYLYHHDGHSGGMCPLLNPDGSPQIVSTDTNS